MKIQYLEADEAVLAEAQALKMHPAAAVVLANRATKYGVSPAWILDTSLQHLDSPFTLPDVNLAADRIADAIMQGEVIALETDHDVDGVTSHAVIYTALMSFFGHPKSLLLSYIGHRLEEGYWLSDLLCTRILDNDLVPGLIITADNGSSDEPRIARLRAEGIDTIVTDHHGMPKEGPPASAYACVSPARLDSQYPDPLIAGVMVAFLLMCVVRQKLVDRHYLDPSAPKLTSLLDYVALGTVADCVSLARSRNNRIVIQMGLQGINAECRPCWRAVRPMMGDVAKEVTATDLAFKVGPMINSAGRLDDAMVGVRYLLADNERDALTHLMELDTSNKLRREIEAEMKEEAIAFCQKQADAGKVVMQVRLENGHPGVHGIVASRLVEAFGRPAVCYSAKSGQPEYLVASARGIDGVHVRDAMERVDSCLPGHLVAFGGHAGAGGMSTHRIQFESVVHAYEKAMAEQVGDRMLEPLMFADGKLLTASITPQLIEGLQALQPYGREFETPMFRSSFKLKSAKPIGAEKTHWKLQLLGREGGIFNAVWFNAGPECPMPLDGQSWLTYSAEFNWWNGRKSVQLMVRHAEEDPRGEG